MTTAEILQRAKKAAASLRLADGESRGRVLLHMADALIAGQADILEANRADMDAARADTGAVMLDRLALDTKRIEGMAKGLREVAALPDPAGRVLERIERPSGIAVEKTAVPLGVVGIIYESRPNVTADAAALCIKSGNACVLRSGKEAWRSAAAIVRIMRKSLAGNGLDADSIGLIEDTSRESAREMMEAVGYIDLLIPRGGAGLIRACVDNAKVPCIETGTGVCHIYVDAAADADMALCIVDNAKTSRPSVCNAAEQCLVHQDIAAEFLPRLAARLRTEREAQGLVPVEFKTDAAAHALIGGTPASEADFSTEFLDYTLGVQVVDGLGAAMERIAKNGTGHSECIVTEDEAAARAFLAGVDAAAVYHNASTRFTDGGEFGLGCEMGISTQKLHARGPMGLRELMTYKYIVRGEGQLRV